MDHTYKVALFALWKKRITQLKLKDVATTWLETGMKTERPAVAEHRAKGIVAGLSHLVLPDMQPQDSSAFID